jgi:hypothetical protein
VAIGAGLGQAGGVKANPILMLAALSLLAPSAAAQGPAAAPAAPAPGEPILCTSAPAQREALLAERRAVNAAIGDIALGRNRKRRKPSGGQVAAGVAGTAASVLLPFGIGALLSAGASAAAKKGRRKKPPPPEPDVPAMIERLHWIDARLAALQGCG